MSKELNISKSPTQRRHGLTDRVLSQKQAREMAGISQPTHYRLEKKGDFPPRVKITEYKQGYLESDMLAWLRARRAHVRTTL